jgi:hypothetical protein
MLSKVKRPIRRPLPFVVRQYQNLTLHSKWQEKCPPEPRSMVTDSEGRAFSPLYPSAKESLTSHQILCHLGNIKPRRSDDR